VDLKAFEEAGRAEREEITTMLYLYTNHRRWCTTDWDTFSTLISALARSYIFAGEDKAWFIR
jgi:hypothetical protein